VISDNEWEQFCTVFKGVIEAIKARSVMRSSNSYLRDPDGLCHSKEFKPHRDPPVEQHLGSFYGSENSEQTDDMDASSAHQRSN
jgi:hypothetical protein